MSQTPDQQRLTISEVAGDLHELVVQQRIFRWDPLWGRLSLIHSSLCLSEIIETLQAYNMQTVLQRQRRQYLEATFCHNCSVVVMTVYEQRGLDEFVTGQSAVSPYVAQQFLLLMLMLMFSPIPRASSVSIDRRLDDRTPGSGNDRNQPIASGVENDEHQPRWKMNLFEAL